MAELTSWKEIAAYLHCSVRTVQRWEKERGLPVRRIPGERGAVYALTAELDEWKQSGRAPLPDEEDPALLAAEARDSSVAEVAAPQGPARFNPSARRASWLSVAAVIAAIASVVLYWIGNESPTAARHAPILLGPTAMIVGGLEKGIWPIRAGDPQRTNRSSFSGPTTPVSTRYLASYATIIPDEVPTVLDDIVVDAAGRFAVGGCAHLQVFDSDGNQVWSHGFARETWDTERPTGMAILTSGVLALGTRGCPHDQLHTRRTHVFAFLQKGNPLWLHLQGGISHSPAVWGNGIIAWIDEFNTVRAYNSAGAIQWTTDLAGFSHGALTLDPEGNVLIGTDAARYGHRSLWSLSPEGRIRWNRGAGSMGTPAIDDIGNIYVPQWPGMLASYSMDGKERWVIDVDEFQPDSLITIGPDRTIYFRTDSQLWRLTSGGEQIWTVSLPSDAYPTGAIVDPDGYLYVAARNQVVSLLPDGTVRWRHPIEGAIRVVPAGSGRMLVMTKDRRVVAISSQAVK